MQILLYSAQGPHTPTLHLSNPNPSVSHLSLLEHWKELSYGIKEYADIATSVTGDCLG